MHSDLLNPSDLRPKFTAAQRVARTPKYGMEFIEERELVEEREVEG